MPYNSCRVPHMLRNKIILFSLTFLFLFILELNNVGLALREKITIGSTLDFSWFSDLIERRLHGYILGRDFTFTYGPLFQFIYSLPSQFFHISSYLSVALSPLLSVFLIFVLVLIIAKSLTKNVFEQTAYILFLFLILGLLISGGTDTVKMLVPIAYSFILYDTLIKKRNIYLIGFVSLLPAFFGLYTYNLFFTTFLITILLLSILLVLQRTKWYEYRFILLIPPLIVAFQILVSLLLTHNFDYIYYSWDAIKNFRYVLDLTWTTDRSNILLVFPLSLLFLGFYLWKTKNVSTETRNALMLLIFVALVSLIYTLSRSDAGHLLFAVYPSLIAFFSIIFFLSKKLRGLLAVACIFYLLVPFKPTFYNTFAPKNILKVIQVIKTNPSFFSLYKLPQNYYYSEREIKNIARIVSEHKNTVYIYPYDSYVLNIEHSTFNSFALGIYTYSGSPVEENMVKGFEAHPPALIILGVDTKGALNLDDIPNFTRNPLVAKWMIKNYAVSQQTPKYLVLSYNPKKTIPKNSCQVYSLSVNLNRKENTLQKIVDTVKPPLYLLDNTRLPYSPWAKNYLVFQGVYSASAISALFENASVSLLKAEPLTDKVELKITRVSPFLRRREIKIFHKNEFSLTCVTL